MKGYINTAAVFLFFLFLFQKTVHVIYVYGSSLGIINHKGNWLGKFFKLFWVEQRKTDESRTLTCELRINVPTLYQMSYVAPMLAVSLICQTFARWCDPPSLVCQNLRSVVPVRSHSTCNCHTARDHIQVYETTWLVAGEGSV